MNILDAFKQLRDDLKIWVTINLNALNTKIDEKTIPTDSELSSTSTNPIQNKAVKKAIATHNIDSAAHTDIREQINTLYNEKVDKDELEELVFALFTDVSKEGQ